MRAVPGILLVVLLLLQSVGTQVLFQVQRYSIRKEIKRTIKQGILEHELTYFTIHNKKDGLQWMNDHEFAFHGRMYDVVSRKQLPGDSTELACISDDDETQLFAHLGNMVQSIWNSPDQHENNLIIQLSLCSPYLPVAPLNLTVENTPNLKHSANYNRHIINASCDSDTPPPEYSFYI